MFTRGEIGQLNIFSLRHKPSFNAYPDAVG